MSHHDLQVKIEPDALAGETSMGSIDVDLHYNKALDRDIKLMEAYRDMPILYDRDHPDFRYVNRKEKAWKELSKKTGLSLENCRKRVTYIRARFTVERRAIRNGQLSSDWPLMEKLKFLHKHVQIRRLRGNEETEPPDVDMDDESHHNNGLHSTFKRSLEDDEELVRLTKRRRSPVEELEPLSPFRHPSMHVPIPEVTTPDICVNGSFQPHKRDENTIFGEYVGEVLKNLPRNLQPQTALKIMQVLVDAQSQQLANQSPRSSTHNVTTD